MIELVFIMLILLAMAKRGRRKFRRYIKGRIDFELALSTLAANTLLSGDESNTLEEQAWLSSIKAVWALHGQTAAASDGPIWVGVAHSAYSDAQIEAWIEEGASWKEGDLVAQEVNQRRIRQVGIFNTPVAAAAASAVVLNDGKPIRTKCGWQLSTGDTVTLWAYNTGSGALTTGSILHVNGHANLWPN